MSFFFHFGTSRTIGDRHFHLPMCMPSTSTLQLPLSSLTAYKVVAVVGWWCMHNAQKLFKVGSV